MTTPKYLYKYRSMASRNIDRAFTHSELYFPSPSTFNDPFDSKAGFSIEGVAESDLRAFYRKIAPVILPTAAEVEREARVEYAMQRHHSGDSSEGDDLMKATVSVLEKTNDQTVGVQCLSETFDDLRMWSYYADGHRGLVLQFDLAALQKAFPFCKSITYTDEYPTLRQFNLLDPYALFDLVLFRKSSHWKHEREWRIVHPIPGPTGLGPSRISRLVPGTITGVILGCTVSAYDRERVEMWVKNAESKIQIYHAVRDLRSFRLFTEPRIETSATVQ